MKKDNDACKRNTIIIILHSKKNKKINKTKMDTPVIEKRMKSTHKCTNRFEEYWSSPTFLEPGSTVQFYTFTTLGLTAKWEILTKAQL